MTLEETQQESIRLAQAYLELAVGLSPGSRGRKLNLLATAKYLETPAYAGDCRCDGAGKDGESGGERL